MCSPIYKNFLDSSDVEENPVIETVRNSEHSNSFSSGLGKKNLVEITNVKDQYVKLNRE